MQNNTVTKNDILKRLKKIEGQIKGIQKMVEEEKYCADILIQIAAVRAAVNKVGGLIVENHSKKCIQKAVAEGEGDKAIEEMVDIMLKFIK